MVLFFLFYSCFEVHILLLLCSCVNTSNLFQDFEDERGEQLISKYTLTPPHQHIMCCWSGGNFMKDRGLRLRLLYPTKGTFQPPKTKEEEQHIQPSCSLLLWQHSSISTSIHLSPFPFASSTLAPQKSTSHFFTLHSSFTLYSSSSPLATKSLRRKSMLALQ